MRAEEDSLPPRRRLCERCLRPATACICRWITPLSSAVDLLILQHPMEVSNAKGSARLLHLSVAGSRMLTGEQFDSVVLQAALAQPGRQAVLLYPETAEDTSTVLAAPELHAEQTTLVVLDGTWRKSRKMLYLNPMLQSLPRLALSGLGASRYRIRKAHAPDQLSTLEAACHALGQLEGDQQKFQALRDRFADFVDVFALNQGRL